MEKWIQSGIVEDNAAKAILLNTHYKYDKVENMVGLLDVINNGILHIVSDEWRNKDHRCHLYNSQHERHFNNLERPWLGVLFYKAPKCEGHIQSCSLHLQLQVHQKPIDYRIQIDFCYQNLIWVWAIHGKTCRVSRFLNDITECSCVHFCLFLSS